MSAFYMVRHQFLKDVDKAPGWGLLLLVNLLILKWGLHPPDQLRVWGWTVPLSLEVLAGACTLVMYVLGDALDEAIFKTTEEGRRVTRKRFRDGYESAKESAKPLGVDHGLYKVALKLAEAAEKERSTLFIHLPNELAKCLRAFIVPFGVAGLVALAYFRLVPGILCLLAAAALFFIYPELKVWHIRRLYYLARDLEKMRQHYHCQDFGSIRIFFWDGDFVTATHPSTGAVEQCVQSGERV